MKFIGLTPDSDDVEDVREFVDEIGIGWPVGYLADESLDALHVSGYPTLIVVGPDGRIVWNDEQGGTLQDALETVLGELPGA